MQQQQLRRDDRACGEVRATRGDRARDVRRLIGAVALVLAAVIGLPMIFDSEPKPVADDIAIQIPSKDKPASPPAATQPVAPPPSTIAASATLDPKEDVVDSPAQAQESTQREASSPKAPAAQLAATPAAKDKQESAKQAELQVAKTETKPEHKHEPKPESKPEAKSEAKSAEKKADDAARAKALLEGKPDPAKSADRKAGKFVIQVAALATKEKIDEVQGKLKAGGLKPYTEKVATQAGDRTRIRVGRSPARKRPTRQGRKFSSWA